LPVFSGQFLSSHVSIYLHGCKLNLYITLIFADMIFSGLYFYTSLIVCMSFKPANMHICVIVIQNSVTQLYV